VKNLTKLRSDYEAKLNEAEAALGGDTPDADLATKLHADAEEIGRQIEEAVEAEAKAAEMKARIDASRARAAEVKRLPFSAGRIEAGESEIDKKAPTGGFKNLGHFAHSIFKAGRNGFGDPGAVAALNGWEDLQRKAPSGMFEASDPDGGALVPWAFSNRLYERLSDPSMLFSYLPKDPVSGNGMTYPKLKENSRANGSRHGGVQAFWEGEADQIGSSRPTFDKLNLRLNKLAVLTYVTNELLEDSGIALESYLGRVVPNEFNFKLADGVLNGNGTGMPAGVLTSASKITVSAESGQGANTIVYLNTVKMFGRMLAAWRGRAIWLYNQECEPQLLTMYQTTGANNGVPVFTPNTASPNGGFSLHGRPALATEQCAALGTEGDLIFFAPDAVRCIVKGTINSAMSMHLRFDYDETAYRWTFRTDVQAADSAALTAFKGSNTYSGIITLNSSRT
jgi:HK97 family phage major capsid protein